MSEEKELNPVPEESGDKQQRLQELFQKQMQSFDFSAIREFRQEHQRHYSDLPIYSLVKVLEDLYVRGLEDLTNNPSKEASAIAFEGFRVTLRNYPEESVKVEYVLQGD